MDQRASERILEEVRTWSDVSITDTGRMGIQVSVGKIELGHVHGDAVAHLPFPPAERECLIIEDLAEPHPIMPNSGWVSRDLSTRADVDHAIALFRQNHTLALARRGRRAGPALSGDAS